MSVAEIDDCFSRMREGELIIDNPHPDFGWFNLAIQRYRSATITSVVPSLDDIRDLLNAISMAAMQGVIIVPRAEALPRSEPGQPEETFVREVRRLIVTQLREPTATINIQGGPTINNAIREIDSMSIPEPSRRRLRQIIDFVRKEYPRIIPLVLDALKRIPSSS